MTELMFLDPPQAVLALAGLIAASAVSYAAWAFIEDRQRHEPPLSGSEANADARARRRRPVGIASDAWPATCRPGSYVTGQAKRVWWDPSRPDDWDQAPPGRPAVAPRREVPAAELPQRPPYQRRAVA